MSLLSETQGRPHTVRAILHTLKSLGGTLPDRDQDLARWFLPSGFPASTDRVRQAIGCATSLGWVEKDGQGQYRLTDPDAPTAPDAFLDHLHVALCTTQKTEDRRILEAYTVVVLQMEEERSTAWLSDWTNKKLADFFDRSLRGDQVGSPRVFNEYKIAPWRDWLEAVGLCWNSEGGALKQFLPDPTSRLQIELRQLLREFGDGREILPYDFLDALGKRMPYLDGGEMFRDISARMQRSLPSDQISLVLARALYDLEDDGALKLVVRGDAATRTLRIPSVDARPARLIVGVTLDGEKIS